MLFKNVEELWWGKTILEFLFVIIRQETLLGRKKNWAICFTAAFSPPPPFTPPEKCTAKGHKKTTAAARTKTYPSAGKRALPAWAASSSGLRRPPSTAPWPKGEKTGTAARKGIYVCRWRKIFLPLQYFQQSIIVHHKNSKKYKSEMTRCRQWGW